MTKTNHIFRFTFFLFCFSFFLFCLFFFHLVLSFMWSKSWMDVYNVSLNKHMIHTRIHIRMDGYYFISMECSCSFHIYLLFFTIFGALSIHLLFSFRLFLYISPVFFFLAFLVTQQFRCQHIAFNLMLSLFFFSFLYLQHTPSSFYPNTPNERTKKKKKWNKTEMREKRKRKYVIDNIELNTLCFRREQNKKKMCFFSHFPNGFAVCAGISSSASPLTVQYFWEKSAKEWNVSHFFWPVLWIANGQNK